MSARIHPFDYQGQAVTFNSDGWINATEAAARFDKRPNDWLSLPTTIEYLEALSRRSVTGLSGNGLMSVKRGGKNQGTWLHPKLAVKFARWLSVDFEIWCDEQVDALVRGELNSRSVARRLAAVGYRSLCDALLITHDSIGKTTKPHHYMNEARLITEVITGAFKGRNRDQLTQAELELIMLVENRDVLLIGQGKDFAARKKHLLGYVGDLQMKLIGSKAA